MISEASHLLSSLETKYYEYKSGIGEISKNETNNREFIVMDYECLHLDKIPTIGKLGLPDNSMFSPDTILHDDNNDILYLIEFKERWPKNDGQNIRMKCYEGIDKVFKFWTGTLQKNREDFFKLEFKFCLITRLSDKIDGNNKSFLNSLQNTNGYFKLKLLEGFLVSEARILFSEEQIFKFLSRVTKTGQMTYIHTNQTEKYSLQIDSNSGEVTRNRL